MADKFHLSSNPFKLFQKLFPKPDTIPAQTLKQMPSLSDEDKEQLAKVGSLAGNLSELMSRQTLVQLERYSLYQELDRAISHPLMAAAVELYAETVTARSRIMNSTVWITSKDPKIESSLNKLLDTINIEEKIFDWAWTTAMYGDMFIRVHGAPGIGITSIEDDVHPLNFSRVDYQGRLIGFYETPLGSINSAETTSTAKLMPPWSLVHIRSLGSKKKKPIYNDPSFTEYRTINLMSVDNRQVTNKYGASVLINGLAPYKRLRLAEDSVMIGRLSKSILRYIYKVKTQGGNREAVRSILESYKALLKRTRAINTGNSPFFDDKVSDLAINEDIILPVFGEANDIQIEKLGGEQDIKWLTDITELRNQLACALRIPLSLLGGYVSEANGPLGNSTLEKQDIRFARTTKRLQRALIDGITRLCLIDLAYKNMIPDIKSFEVQMSETSAAEEEEIVDSLTKSMDIADKVYEFILKVTGEQVNKLELYKALNNKFIKLSDIDIDKLISKVSENPKAVITIESIINECLVNKTSTVDSDIKALLPTQTITRIDESGKSRVDRSNDIWEKQYKGLEIQITSHKQE